MPLHGKIVVIKRSGVDGTEFPLTAACLFGRKPECDIRIQLPQVSKEHCRIELNENKEVILTNLSSVNPTLINGKPMQQSERLKYGDLITIIDRSFRFECPPEPTPKKNIPPAKRKSETLQVLQEHQVREADALVSGEKGKYPQTPEQTWEASLKDGTNMVLASVGDSDEAVGKQAFVTGLDQSKSTAKEVLSPFSELYEMTKQSFSEKLPRKSEQPKTPCSRRDSKMEVVPQNTSSDKPDSSSGADVTPKSGRRSMKITPGRDDIQTPTQKLQDAIEQVVTPVQVTPKVRRATKSPAKQLKAAVSEDQLTPISQKKNHISTPQKFTAAEVAQHVLSQGTSVLEDCTISKSVTPKTRRSKEAHSPAGGEGGPRSPGRPFVCTPNQAEKKNGQSVEVKEKSPRATVVSSNRTSPRTTARKLQVLSECETAPSCGENEGGQSGRYKKRKSGDLGDLPVPLMKRKRVSFGGQLTPELFDKRLPPNSPLRKGATPGRRSLSVLKKQHPVLRRASIIGLIQELPSEKSSSENPKASSPRMRVSSKAGSTSRTPSPAKKTPAAKSKIPSPGKTKSPKVKPGTLSKEKGKSPSRRSSKTVDQSPTRRRSSSKENPLTFLKSPASQPQTPGSVSGKTTTPRRRESSSAGSKSSPKTTSPKGESLSSELSINDSSASQTPIVRGRFSVSRIETPSPVADQDTAAPESFASSSSVSVTPSVLLRRVSLKSAKATPRSARRSALELMRLRRSGASQANLKVLSSWADIVKFGTTKAQTENTAKKRISRGKTVRTVKQKLKPPKTPIQKLKGHFSTGHAESPATIVVGKAHAKTVLPTGCAPKFVRNTALTKESMNMNEDLTGIAEIFSTPMNTRQKRANSGKSQSLKTPQDVPLSEASVIKTPEETGEMVVSPLSVTSTVKPGCYNSEAVVRLLTDDQECSFTCSDSVQQKATSDMISSEHAEQQDLVLETMVVTPKQKPESEMPLTGVKRLMKTPKQKSMQKEDLTGIRRLLKTPKQPKVSEEVSLIGVKELLKTPMVKDQPIDIVGVQRITPKVKNEPQVFTTGVKRLMRTAKRKNEPVDDMVGLKRLMKTPKQKNKPVEDSFGVRQLLQTPKQKREPVEDMVGLKRLMRTPKQKNEPVEDMVGLKRLMRTPKQKNEPVEDTVGLKRMRTPKQKNEPVEDMVGLKRLMRTPKQKNEPVEDMVGLKRLMRTPKQKNEPVEDMVGLKRLMRTPKQKGKPVENKFGIAKLMKSPKIRGTIAVEDYTGLQELMQEPEEVPVARIISKCDLSEHLCANPCPSMNGEIFTSAEAKVAFEEPLELPESQSNTSKKAVRGRKKSDIPAEDKSADSKRDPAVRAAEPIISEVKSKRGRPTRRGLPSTLGEELHPLTLTPAAATPVKTTRGRRAKLVPGAAEDKPDENLSGGKAGKPRESNETMHVAPEITEQGAQVEPSAKTRQGSKVAAVSKNALTPVRKAGRGRTAKRMVDAKAAVEMQSVVTGHGQELVSASQVTKPRRGKKTKSDENNTASESLKKDVSEKEPNLVTVAEEPASPIVKPRRGRTAKTLVKEAEQPSPAVLPAKRMRRGGPSDATAMTASSVHSSRPGRGRKALDTQEEPQEEKLVQSDASSTEVGIKSMRNTRGSRKNNPIADAGTASVCVAAPVPSKLESTVPPNESPGLDNLVIQNKNTTRRGKAAPQDSKANKADKKSAVEETVAIKAALKRVVSKKMAKSDSEIPDSQDVTELPGSERTTEPSTKPRRGRGAKKPNIECSEPTVSDQISPTQSTPLKSSKVNEPAAKDVIAAKRGAKRKVARDEPAEHLEEASAASPSRPSTTKRVRGKAARLDENKPAMSPVRGKRGPAKKTVKTTEKLEGSQQVETPKPVGRGRKRVVHHMEPEPVSSEREPVRGNARITEPSDGGKVKSAARGRRKSPTKPEAPSVSEARPVRSTRRK